MKKLSRQEMASAVDVIDAGEEVVAAFDGDGDARTGALTGQQCVDAADALKIAMDAASQSIAFARSSNAIVFVAPRVGDNLGHGIEVGSVLEALDE